MLEIAFIKDIPSSAQYFLDAHTVDGALLPKPSVDLKILQCNNCTHVQGDSDLVSYYKDVITASSLSPSIVESRDDTIREICALGGLTDPVIVEIGAFEGQYVNHLLITGFANVYGIENSSTSVKRAKEKGLKLTQGYLLDHNFESSSIPLADILLCFNFLEHVPDPFLFLQNAKNKLANKEAYFYFTMPSFAFIERTGLLQEFIPDHVSYFTPRSLSTLFSRCSMEVVHLQSINNDNDLEIVARMIRSSVGLLSPEPFNHLVHTINLILDDAHSQTLTVAFWGAGHRSLTLISQLHHKHISYIVDSAPFKQSKMCPDTGLSIVSPAQYFDGPTDILVLSLPGIYADEVISSLSSISLQVAKLYLIEGNQITDVTSSIYR